jgi:hypothetical protein
VGLNAFGARHCLDRQILVQDTPDTADLSISSVKNCGKHNPVRLPIRFRSYAQPQSVLVLYARIVQSSTFLLGVSRERHNGSMRHWTPSKMQSPVVSIHLRVRFSKENVDYLLTNSRKKQVKTGCARLDGAHFKRRPTPGWTEAHDRVLA